VHASGDGETPMIVVSGNVLEAETKCVMWEPDACAFRPFNEHNLTAVENVVPPNIREIFRSVQSIKVEVVDCCAAHLIRVHERERRAGHIFTNSKTSTNRLGESRLSGAQISLKCNDGGRPKALPEFLPPFPQLVNRES